MPTDGIINPLNYYAMSKATVDYWVQDNMHKFSHIQGFKFFNVYGPGEVHKGEQASLVSKFQWQSATGAIHPFQGSDKVLRDYIWVGDVVNVVMTNNAGSGIFDLGTGKNYLYPTCSRSCRTKKRGNGRRNSFPTKPRREVSVSYPSRYELVVSL